ncbi:hypothetical protein GA0115240_16443 [Streptomyces sp. DvalAA-14]|uniref:hypothetical protein n=1 Tax=unclassified Streptomyces TaxID=2593676 RepID=UPI00081B9D18|nr:MULTISPECIES: hypothetical protein [unclassified Streptomyces]SCE46429.1 hypothetical protein GA0115240_16443 [Streptomyces sp. DvalAA-14]
MAAAVLSLPKSGSTQVPLFATPLPKKPLPAGLPREWYVAHNRRLKTMRLVIALLDSGVYEPAQAGNRKIHDTAELIGVHPPSDITCRMVRALLGYGR